MPRSRMHLQSRRVSGALYVLVSTACAVTEKDHKIFNDTGSLVRKQTFSNSTNFCQPMTHIYFLVKHLLSFRV